METILNYGKQKITLSLSSPLAELINPVQTAPLLNLAELPGTIEAAINKQALAESKSVAIAVNDKTRPVNYQALLPPLLDVLKRQLQPECQISFFVASGTHKPMHTYELGQILPDSVVKSYPIHVHDSDDQTNLEFLGTSSRNTPVWINKAFMQTDYKIVVGNIEPHHFMGFSGGVKTAAIGLAGRKTIETNHSMLIHDPHTAIGEYETNPMRMDVEEIGDLLKVDFALNAVQNNAKEIIKVFCGAPRIVSESALPTVRELCLIPIQHQYPIVIASAGGYPKDINLYQAQKAITNAAKFTADGGDLYLFAECIEGIGNEKLEKFMQGVMTTAGVRDKLQTEGFTVGPHKAYLIARDLDRVNIHLISSLPAELVKLVLLDPLTTSSFTREMLPALPVDKPIAVIPNAVAAIPYFEML